MSLRGRMALLFVMVVTAVLTLAAVSFDYFCRLHFERQDVHVLENKVAALKAILTRGDSLNPAMISEVHQLVDTSFGFAAAIMAGNRVIYSHHNLSEELCLLYTSDAADE